jgi:hypothetical protein
VGSLAANLFRAQKSSTRAKRYRGDSQEYAYDRKGNVLQKVCDLLQSTSFSWGWGVDPRETSARHVLYVDLPQGQVSFHLLERGLGPDYSGKWDRSNESEERVLDFCQSIFDEADC